MLVTILSLIHNITTLLFGVYASAAFLGIRLNRKNNLTLLTFSCITGVFYAFSYILYGTRYTEQIDPLMYMLLRPHPLRFYRQFLRHG